MPTLSISIVTPTDGSTVFSPIPVSGTYSCPTPNPTIDCSLQDSSGTTVASTATTGTGGQWSATLTVSQGYTGASITATLGGTQARASVGNLTVDVT